MVSDTNPCNKKANSAATGGKKRGKNAKGAGKAADKTVSFSPNPELPTQRAVGEASNGAVPAPALPPDTATLGSSGEGASGSTPPSAANGVPSLPDGSAEGVSSPDGAGGTADSPAEPREVTQEEKMAIAKAGYKRLCSDATLQTKKDGYFGTYDSQVTKLQPC